MCAGDSRQGSPWWQSEHGLVRARLVAGRESVWEGEDCCRGSAGDGGLRGQSGRVDDGKEEALRRRAEDTGGEEVLPGPRVNGGALHWERAQGPAGGGGESSAQSAEFEMPL